LVNAKKFANFSCGASLFFAFIGQPCHGDRPGIAEAAQEL
jgi:hypothetical protein